MADYFLSDVHLRLDRPERGRRLARLVDQLAPQDRLFIVGDLCDFWFASRQQGADPMACPGLSALVRLQERGVPLTLMLGNHDAWLGPFYESLLRLEVQPEPLVIVSHGQTIRLAHGHRVKGTSTWKSLMEGRAFLGAFGLLPGFLARDLESRLDRVNTRKKAEADRRLIAAYREMALACDSEFDIIVFGHVHHAYNNPEASPRLIVLGDWTRGASYLKIDATGAELVIERGAEWVSA